MKQAKRTVRTWILALAATALALLMGGCTSYSTIKLEDYYTLSFTGFDGEGKAVIEKEGFSEALLAELVNHKVVKARNVLELLAEVNSNEALKALSRNVDSPDFCQLDQAEGLSNGDKVMMTFHYNNDDFKNTGIRLEGKKLVFTVKGLEEIRTFDAFEGLQVSWTGSSAQGKTVLSRVPNNGLTYTASEPENLKNGDTVTVTVSYGAGSLDDYARQYGMKPAELSKTFEVSGLQEAQVVDVFKGMEIHYTGVSPYTNVEIQNSSPYDLVYFVERLEGYVAKGEKLTIGVRPNSMTWEEFSQKYGVIPETTSKTITVDDVAEYITSVDQISREGWAKLQEMMADQYAEHFAAYQTGDYHSPTFTEAGDMPAKFIKEEYFRNFKWVKAILVSMKDEYRRWGSMQNRLYFVYSCDLLEDPEGHWKECTDNVGAFYLRDVAVGPDGSILLTDEEVLYTYAVKGEDRFLNDNILQYQAEYEITETPIDWQ